MKVSCMTENVHKFSHVLFTQMPVPSISGKMG